MLKIAVFVLCFYGPQGWLLAGLLVLGSILRDSRRRREERMSRSDQQSTSLILHIG